MSCGNGKEWRRWRNQGALMGKRKSIQDELAERFRKQSIKKYECETCRDDPHVCAEIPGLRHCANASDEVDQ